MAWGAVAGAVVGAVASNAMSDSGGGGGSAQGSSDAANTTAHISQDQWNYYKNNYQPLESNLINQANQAGSQQEYDAARGRANADVTNAFDQVNKQTASRLQSYGINPGSPAYQSSMASNGLAQGAASAGAQAAAYNNQKALQYSKALDVVGIGRNIPAQSAASSANAANSLNSASQTQFYQNQQNMRNTGNALKPAVDAFGGAAKSWFNNQGSNDPTNSSYWGGNNQLSGGGSYDNGYGAAGYGAGASSSPMPEEGFSSGGKVTRYARGGLVGNAKQTLMNKGIPEHHAHKAIHNASRNRAITPHLKLVPLGLEKRYADGGGIGRQGMEDQPDASNMGMLQGQGTETSDSIPAEIDGQQPAALSKNEFVMNAEVPKMSGDEILTAINNAGLQKRQQTSAQVPPDAGMTAYRCGGLVRRA